MPIGSSWSCVIFLNSSKFKVSSHISAPPNVWYGYTFQNVPHTSVACERLQSRALVTFEEMTTVLSQIDYEACLNSRPLTVLSSNIDSVEVLTPGHFLTGRRLFLIHSFVQASLGLEMLAPLSAACLPFLAEMVVRVLDYIEKIQQTVTSKM